MSDVYEPGSPNKFSGGLSDVVFRLSSSPLYETSAIRIIIPKDIYERPKTRFVILKRAL